MKAQTLFRSSRWVVGLLLAGAIPACTAGTADDPTKPGGPLSSAGSAGTTGPAVGSGGASSQPVGGGGTPGAAGSIVIGGPPVPESAGTMVMRRLNYREYDHMLAQLLGDTTSPASGLADAWSPDTPSDSGFVTPMDVQAYHVTQFNQTADTLVNTALAALAAGKTAGKFVIPCKNPTAAQEVACATTFIQTFGKEVYRRPVTAAELGTTTGDVSTAGSGLLNLFNTVRTTNKASFTDSIGAVAKAMLQSPNFLYHWEIGDTKPVKGADGLVPLTPWQVASRMATALWESMPDDTLLTAAASNQLSTPDQVAAQVQRMLGDAQVNNALYNFHLQWFFNMGFHVTDLTSVSPKGTLLTAAAAAGLQQEFTQFISSVYLAPGDGTLKTLYTAPYAFVNKDLAAIYGVAPPAGAFGKVMLDPTQRAGIFTQVSFLGGIQDSLADNPVYRGLAVYTKALCGHMSPPDVPPAGLPFVTSGTTRQSYDKHGSNPCASGCHAVFDPPGFAFENYDGVGQYRTTENGVAVDSSGSFAASPGGTMISFNNAVEMVTQLAASPEAQTCIDRQWARYSLGRLETAAETGSLQAAYTKGAATPGFSIRDMLTALFSSKAFLYRTPSDGEQI